MFQRALLTFELGADPRPAVALLLALAPKVEQVVVVARVKGRTLHALLIGDRAPSPASDPSKGLEALAAIARVELVAQPDGDAWSSIAATHDGPIDLVVVGAFPDISRAQCAARAVDAGRALAVPVAIVGSDPSRSIRAERRHLVAAFRDIRGRAVLGAFARDHLGADDRVTLLSIGDEPAPSVAEVARVADLAGAACAVDIESLDVGLFDAATRLAGEAVTRAADLFVWPHENGWFQGLIASPSARDVVATSTIPTLVLPPLASTDEGREGLLDAADVVVTSDAITIAPEQVGALGSAPSIDGTRIVAVAHGRLFAEGVVHEGSVTIDVSSLAVATGCEVLVGLGRATAEIVEPLGAIETRARWIWPDARKILLISSTLGAASLASLVASAQAAEAIVACVRMSTGESYRAIRARLSAIGFASPIVLDAGQILDEGDPSDLSPTFDDVRLARVAARLRLGGAQVAAIVTTGTRRVGSAGFAVVGADRIESLSIAIAQEFKPGSRRSDLRSARLDDLACALATPGNRLRVQLDNHAARADVIAAIDGARERVHLQVYIVTDDATVATIEQALVRAARRGVAVRILVDSLLSAHGSFGAKNALLERLEREPRIDVRAIAPVTGVPTMEQLKQRDHRKLLVIDGARAIVTGRNLARAYYAGFEEVALRPDSPWQDVPWLDAAVVVEGPSVATIEACFQATWRSEGGDLFDAREVDRAGDTSVRVVVHRGLEDARTLEAYLAIIDGARTTLRIVNCFPFQLEVQHALRRALRRGVRVCVLIGNVRPMHGEGVPFVGGAVRDLATELVQSRLDPLIDDGAEVYELGVRDVAGWDPTLGVVHPHVHAKIVVSDGEIGSIGSANLDLTSAYWESEAIVVVEDKAFVTELEASIDALLATSTQITRDDPRRAQHAGRREWLAKHWPIGVIG